MMAHIFVLLMMGVIIASLLCQSLAVLIIGTVLAFFLSWVIAEILMPGSAP